MDEAVQISAAKESCLMSNLNIIKKVTIGSLRYWLQDAHTKKIRQIVIILKQISL